MAPARRERRDVKKVKGVAKKGGARRWREAKKRHKSGKTGQILPLQSRRMQKRRERDVQDAVERQKGRLLLFHVKHPVGDVRSAKAAVKTRSKGGARGFLGNNEGGRHVEE